MNKDNIKLISQVQKLYEEDKINPADKCTVKRELAFVLSGGDIEPSTSKWLQSLVNRGGAAFSVTEEKEQSIDEIHKNTVASQK